MVAPGAVRLGSRVVQLGCDTFVEIGPHPVLTAMAHTVVPDHGTWVSSLRRQRDDHHHILHSLATLYTAGTPIDWTTHHTHHPHHRPPAHLPLPRQHHWCGRAAGLPGRGHRGILCSAGVSARPRRRHVRGPDRRRYRGLPR